MPLPCPEFEFNKVNHPANLARISRELSKISKTDPKVFTANTRAFLGD
jgi:hypothetical protein